LVHFEVGARDLEEKGTLVRSAANGSFEPIAMNAANGINAFVVFR
jgi:hypothetical protein